MVSASMDSWGGSAGESVKVEPVTSVRSDGVSRKRLPAGRSASKLTTPHVAAPRQLTAANGTHRTVPSSVYFICVQSSPIYLDVLNFCAVAAVQDEKRCKQLPAGVQDIDEPSRDPVSLIPAYAQANTDLMRHQEVCQRGH